MTEVYDSATWPEAPPSTDYGMKYADGEFAKYQDRVEFTHTRFITVHGHYRVAGAIDYEPGNWAYNPWTLTRYVTGRRGMDARSRLYCDRADARQALQVLGWHGQTWPPGVITQTTPLWAYTEWWIGTLDGDDWPAEDLAADLASRWGAPIPVSRLWGNQWTQVARGGIDQTRLYLTF